MIEHFPKCNKNHDGTAMSMESSGLSTIVKRSMQKHRLQYTTYIGDGDSKAFKRIVNEKPYGEKVIKKEECIGHVQKRMGTRLRSATNKKKGVKLKDGKGLSGRGRLTHARIDFFQCLYGRAIRNNPGDAAAMSRQTKAILHHYSSPANHEFCKPAYCTHLRDDGKGKLYENLLPPAVKEELEPIFKDLSNLKLLKGCENLNSQNQNESFHHLLWSFLPKDQAQSPEAMQLGINLAVMVFNSGYSFTLNEMCSALEISVSCNAKLLMQGFDKARVYHSWYKSTGTFKEARKTRRNSKRRRMDAFKEVEGIQYQSGLTHRSTAPGTDDARKGQKPRSCVKCKVSLHLLKGTGHTKANCKG